MKDNENLLWYVLGFVFLIGVVLVMELDLFVEARLAALPLEEVWLVSAVVLVILIGVILKTHHKYSRKKKKTPWKEFLDYSAHDKISLAVVFFAMIILVLVAWNIDQGQLTLTHLEVEEEWLILIIGIAAWLFSLRRFLLPSKK